MGSDSRDALGTYLAFQLTELEGYLPLIAAADQEAIHGARLALRRLRSVLSCYKEILPKVPGPVREEVRWLARSLGEARDAYVLGKRIALSLDANGSWRAPGPLHASVDALMAASGRSAAALGAGKRSRRAVQAAREALLAGKRKGKGKASHRLRQDGRNHTLDELAQRLQTQWETLQLSLAAEATATDEAERNTLLHQARKDIKCLRYAVEAAAEAFGPTAAGIIQPAIAMQRILGEQHDSVVAGAWLEALAASPGVDSSDAAELRAMEARRLAGAEAQFRAAAVEFPVPAPRRVLLF
ncbi:CHAD domain-containing protein [Arthrobacter sp. CJ23]|uniref:CHAD domain-containing protein n=1 Tax=Arthrobacter sp. CJ23 TaxID=2972479 RepID=UPI00215BEB1B|nr:CHAD domain-containing protein [Arthrobacter sp. CJ23]UVJ38846.1 CHAD domain-containing protein [Arthrobacter sp. CJ23]